MMNMDFGQIQQVLSAAKFPIGKQTLIEFAQQHGANEAVLGLLQNLPDKTFDSPQDVQNALSGHHGNIGGFSF